MEKNKQDYFNRIHRNLAIMYHTEPEVIHYVRSIYGNTKQNRASLLEATRGVVTANRKYVQDLKNNLGRYQKGLENIQDPVRLKERKEKITHLTGLIKNLPATVGLKLQAVTLLTRLTDKEYDHLISYEEK